MKKFSFKISSVLVLCGIVSIGMAAPCSQVTESMAPDAIAARIKPVGQIAMEGGGAAKPASATEQPLAENAGEERYKSTCAVCHATGVAGAPKFRDKADWAPRMKDGIDGMLAIAIKGKGGMPPKGTCMQCSDAELKATIEYMVPKK